MWRKFSKSGDVTEPVRQAPEGVPPYLMDPLVDWLQSALYRRYDDGLYRRVTANYVLLRDLQLHAQLDPPLARTDETSPADDLVARVRSDEEFALAVMDYVLRNLKLAVADQYRHAEYAAELEAILKRSGSVWQVVPSDDRTSAQLARRDAGPVREVLADLPASSRGHQHLVRSWNRLKGREPDYPSAYREAIRAVEAVAKPVILPDNLKATLGTMRAAISDKPEKWITTIGSMHEIEVMLASVWTAQLDRHGTDDESVPLDVSPEETDAAFAVCLALVRLFVGGHVRAAGA